MGGPRREVAAVHVWTCGLDGPGTAVPRLRHLVTASEADRADRFRSAPQRVAALASAAFVRAVVADAAGVAPLDLGLSSACRRCGHPTHGKPHLASPGARPVEFSLAHAPGLALLAVSSRAVGVDVEARAGTGLDGARRLALTDEERRDVDGAADPDGATLRRWTHKEAYLKGIGTGLARDPTLVSFRPPEAGWARVVDDGTATGWWVSPVDVGPGSTASLAVEGGPCAVTVRAWSPPWTAGGPGGGVVG